MNSNLLSSQVSRLRDLAYENIITQLQNQNFACVDDFFEIKILNNLHQRIMSLYESDKLKKSAIGKYFDEHIQSNIRGDYIQWIDHKKPHIAEQGFFEHIQDFAFYLNRTCFMGLLHKEFHYAVYPEGKFYKRHLDVFKNDKRRKLSVILYLNRNWSKLDGGELVIYLRNKDKSKTLTIEPKFGRFVVFESQLLEHEVKVVKRDMRLSITGWLKTM